jgi:hypothetical protein
MIFGRTSEYVLTCEDNIFGILGIGGAPRVRLDLEKAQCALDLWAHPECLVRPYFGIF